MPDMRLVRERHIRGRDLASVVDGPKAVSVAVGHAALWAGPFSHVSFPSTIRARQLSGNTVARGDRDIHEREDI